MDTEAIAVATYIEAAAALSGMPLDAEHRAGAIVAMTRLAAFAADVATVDLGNDVEIAGVFVP